MFTFLLKLLTRLQKTRGEPPIRGSIDRVRYGNDKVHEWTAFTKDAVQTYRETVEG